MHPLNDTLATFNALLTGVVTIVLSNAVLAELAHGLAQPLL